MKQPQPRSLEIGYYRDIKKTVDAWNEAVVRYSAMIPAGDERSDGYFEDKWNEFIAAVAAGLPVPDFVRHFSQTALFNWTNWMRQVKNGTKYELPATMPFNEPGISRLATQWIDVNTKLIRGFNDQRDAQLKNLIFRGVTQGKSRRQLIADILPSVRALNNIAGASTRLSAEQRADLIATDQILTANAQLTAQRMANANVEYYIWRGTEDSRERPAHLLLNDKIFRVDGEPMTAEDFKIVGRTGQKEKTPGAEVAPGIPIRCRCYAEAVFNEF